MSKKKNINILSTIILLLASSYLFVTTISYAAEATELFGFMDLESSIKDLQQKVEKVRKSTVLVVAYDKSGIVSKFGSGFFIDNKGRIITNALIMKDAYSAKVYSKSNQYEKVTILNRIESIDLMLLEVNEVNEAPIELDYKSKVKPGDRVFIVGKSSKLTTTVSEGLISSMSIIGKTYDFIEIETTAGLLSYSYSKDGPVINMEGKVIGIATKVTSDFMEEDFLQRVYDGEKINAISIKAVKQLVESPNRIERLHPAGTRVWFHWVLRKLKDYSVFIFVTLYNLGFTKIMEFVVVLILLISFIQWLYCKFIKTGK